MPDSKPDHIKAPGQLTSARPMNPVRTLMRLITSGGWQSRLTILIYHRVLPQRDPLFPEEVDATTFDQHMGHLASCFKVLPLHDAVRRLRNGSLPHNAACVTFDDGYADNAEVALPILQKHGITATFFVATGFLNGGRMWNDTVIELVRRAPGPLLDLSHAGLGRFQIETLPHRRQAIFSLLNALKYLPLESRQMRVDEMAALIPVIPPNDLMMTSDQIRILHNAGMEIGGHTKSHPILARMDYGAARAEIAHGKETLESVIRAPIHVFAYPNGKPGQDYLPDHVAMVKNLGFEAAVSTAWGAAKGGSDLYQLPRFTPWDRGRVRFTLRMAQNMLRTTQTV
jgi:peptidoglycan/xylan/chitin deacetylase (PgdA/CDA1 family)